MQQADFVVDRTLALRDEEDVPLSQIAVLYRAHYHSMELQMELTRRGIPFEIRSGLRFFEQRHIKDVTAFLTAREFPCGRTGMEARAQAPARRGRRDGAPGLGAGEDMGGALFLSGEWRGEFCPGERARGFRDFQKAGR